MYRLDNDNILIDWMEYTVLNPTTEYHATDWLDIEPEWFQTSKGKHGYKTQLIDQTSKLIYLKDGNQGMGHHVIASGNCCRYLDNNVEENLFTIFRLHTYGAQFTRVDIALDIRDKPDLFNNILHCYHNNLVISKFRTSKIIQGKTNQEINSNTIYFGSRQSNIMLRIYNKALEQGIDGDWIRFELVFKKEYIPSMIEQIASTSINTFVKGILNNYIKFVDKKEKNVSRSKACKWWDEIIENIEKIKLYKEEEENTLDEVKEWLLKQVSNSLYTVVASDLSRDFIEQMLRHGANNLKDRHYNMIDKEHRLKGVNV